MAHLPPTIEDLIALADAALAAMPPDLAKHVKGVAIQVVDEADDETLDAFGLESSWDISGLYRGTPIGMKDAGGVPHGPDMIFLYRLPILLEWIETGEDLAKLVSSVLIHEIAHHFGFSDDDIARIERMN